MARSKRLVLAATLVGVAAITLAACSSNSSSSTTTGATASASSVKSGGTLTMALDENLAGFNINTSAANEFVLQEILDTVWPQPYIVNAALKPVLNTDLITKVAVTSQPPDHHLHHQSQGRLAGRHADRGRRLHLQLAGPEREPAYTDVGGQPYDDGVDLRLQPDRLGHRLQPARRRRLRPGLTADRQRRPVPERQAP